MEKEYLYEFAENALKEALVDVTNKISEGYKVCGMEPMFRVANQNSVCFIVHNNVKFLCETYRGTRALYIFYANCGILLPYALMNCPSSFGVC